MQADLTQVLTDVIEFIKRIVDELQIYLLNRPTEVFLIVCAAVALFILFRYLPQILAALYKDLIQLFKILLKWSVFGVIFIFAIWTIASFSTTCGFINQHLGTKLNCTKPR